MSIRLKAVRRLVDLVKKDPDLFHALVFYPDSAIERLGFLSAREKATILKGEAQAWFAWLEGVRLSCGASATCSCTTGTCTGTCGGKTCSVTCSGDSCGRTCENSCSSTASIGRFGGYASRKGF